MFQRTFLKELNKNLGEDVVIYVSFKDDIITGARILLKNKTGYVSMVGVDHEALGNDYTYFNICFYKPITDAIANKMTKLYFGREMYESKARRGCRT